MKTKLLPALGLSLVLGLGSTAVLQAQDAPADAPAEKKPAPLKPAKTPRLTQPWSKMSSLTSEQKQQIGAIHKKAVADKKAIDDKEDADIMALLNDDQKAEVSKILDEGAAAKKKAPKAAETPATQPDAGM